MVTDYNNGKIYKICSFQTDNIYVGSTTQLLCKRMYKHRFNMKQHSEGKYRYTGSFDILKYDDAKIILIENFPCNTKTELEARERFHIENNICSNKVIPQQTQKEYYQKNKNKMDKWHIDYRLKNNDKIKQYKNTKIECGQCNLYYSRNNKSYHVKSKKHLDKINK